jgi:hypothetical protein
MQAGTVHQVGHAMAAGLMDSGTQFLVDTQ